MTQVLYSCLMQVSFECYMYAHVQTATPGCDYTLNAQTLIFIYNELNNINNISCVNLTILEDNIPENEQYITIGLFNENSNIVIIPSRNQTTIAILDGDAGMLLVYYLAII